MKLKSLLASLSLLAATSGAHAALGTLDTVPAATVLVPYFEVDTTNANGLTGQFTVSNVGSTEQVARVTLWSDRGVPVFAFDMRLPANGTTEVNLRSLLTTGTLPASTAGGVSSCGGILPYGTLSAATTQGIRDALSGRPSSLLGGQCAASTVGNARGFATIDAVNGCTASNSVFPTSVGYFGAGGTGLASNNNVLIGEYAFVDANAGVAYGDALVSVEAGVTSGNTFYGLMAANGVANEREALPNAYTGRFSRIEGTFPNTINDTKAIIWRDPGLAAPFACTATGPVIPGGVGTVFDHQEEALGPLFVGSSMGLATQMRSAAALAPAGHVVWDLQTSSDPDRQAFVAHIAYSNGFGSGNSAEAGMSSGTPYFPGAGSYDVPDFPFPACSDGIDNDADGLIDFPADPQCSNSQSNNENPQCSDGIDNDADGQTDFPNDLSCAYAFQDTEVTACSDGIDQDGDMLIDFPADIGCRSPADIDESFPLNECSDGVDNNNDGRIDFPNDPTCFSPFDQSEGTVRCSNGFDDDLDGLTDFPADPGCFSATDSSEDPEGCSDGLDNDSDGLIDFPNDLGCTSPGDTNEVNPQCIDGIDNDADGLTDFPLDLGCSSANDFSETFGQCDDGVDNDGDMLVDFPADPGCASASSSTERPQCNDNSDNDFDGLIDFPADPDCTAASDNQEESRQCSDGIDNDNDGLIDFPDSPNCQSASDPYEVSDCSDGLDNDNDGLADFTGSGMMGADPGCASAADGSEFASVTAAACSDGQDNDGDSLIDFPSDPGCASAGDNNEFAFNQAQGGNARPIPAAAPFGLMLLIVAMMAAAGLAMGRRQG